MLTNLFKVQCCVQYKTRRSILGSWMWNTFRVLCEFTCVMKISSMCTYLCPYVSHLSFTSDVKGHSQTMTQFSVNLCNAIYREEIVIQDFSLSQSSSHFTGHAKFTCQVVILWYKEMKETGTKSSSGHLFRQQRL